MATESDYLVKNAKIVFNHFNELITKKCLITAHFGDRNASFLTTIVDLDKNNHIITLDCGPSDEVDKQLLSSGKVLFRTEVDGIKVSFSGQRIRKVQTDGDWVFSMPLPDSIFWMQRRQYYRVKIPLSHTSSYCELGFEPETEAGEPRKVIFPLCDLSITGFSFLNIDPKLTAQLQPDTQFLNCTLHLHNGNQALISFVIKNNIKIRTNSMTMQDRIGCLIQEVSTSFETSMQRYMQDIELQQKIISQS